MRKLLLTMLAMTAALTLTSCTGSITSDVEEKTSFSGVITDFQNGSRLSNTTITICQTGASCTTNGQGEFNFGNVEPDKSYKIKFAHSAYLADSLNVEIKKGDHLYKSIKMIKAIPVINLSTYSIDFGQTSESASFTIANTGNCPLSWNISENCSWISSVTPASGTCLPGKNILVKINISRSQLPDACNSSFLQITSNGGDKNISITADNGGNGGGGGNNGK